MKATHEISLFLIQPNFGRLQSKDVSQNWVEDVEVSNRLHLPSTRSRANLKVKGKMTQFCETDSSRRKTKVTGEIITDGLWQTRKRQKECFDICYGSFKTNLFIFKDWFKNMMTDLW